MREGYPIGPGHDGDPGDQVVDPTALTPEAVALLGEDTVRYMDRATGALEELGLMAETDDPFIHDDRGYDLDLGFLKPDQADMVVNYRVATRPFRGMSVRTIAKFGRKIIRNVPLIKRDVSEQVDSAEPYMDEAMESIKKVADETPDNMETSVLDALQRSMEKLMTARDVLPSRTTMLVVDNLYASGLNARNTVESRATQPNVIRISSTKAKAAIAGFVQELRDGRESFKGTARVADSLRKLGSANFNRLQVLVGVERKKEVLGIMITADNTRRRLSEGVAGLEGDDLEAAKTAAERYLADRADMAASVLRCTDPDLLRSNYVRSLMARLNVAERTGDSNGAEQAGQRVSLDNEVLSKLTEAKNILRGGRRLKPGKGQAEADIKRTADELHALKDGDDRSLLDPEESGVIVAMVTGKFAGYAHVAKAVKQYAASGNLEAFPAERLGVARELDRFDLTSALTKIGSLLEDPDSRLHLDRALGLENARRIHADIQQALTPEAPESEAAA